MSELKVYHHELRHNEYEEFYLKYEADKVIEELKDKCQMHDFFWEGCGFAKLGFKNAIAVSDAYDFLEEENKQLQESITVYQRNEKISIRELHHHKYKRCLAMASNCRLRARWFGDNAFYKKEQWALQWHRRWLELAEKFKPNREQ
jgi:hypothetical protein